MIEIELNIAAQGASKFTITTVLSGQSYQLTFTWSVRSLAWYMDIDETIQGVKVVNGIDLLAPYSYIDNLPTGKLGAYRNSGKTSKPDFFNFGVDKEVTLVYEE